MQVTISATSIGGNAGPFTITDDLSNTIATGITRSQILSGYTATVNDSATSINLISSGICTNTTSIGIVSPSPTPSPTPITLATLQYEISGIAGGTVTVSINGDGTPFTTDTALTSVSVNSGDHLQMSYSIPSTSFTTFIDYYINGVYQTTYSGTTTITTSIVTASAGNTYKFVYNGAA